MRKFIALVSLLATAACGSPELGSSSVDAEDGVLEPLTRDIDVSPSGRGGGVFNKFQQGDVGKSGSGSKPSSNGILYHGGPVMLGTVNAYVIWYGNWNGNTATAIIPDLLSNIGGSPYYNINTTYDDGAGTKLSNSVSYKGSAAVAYPYGNSLSDAQIANVVTDSILAGVFPLDPNAVYFVLTSADVTATSGFCTSYCGWHWYTSVSGTTIKYSFVGNPDRCPTACSAQSVSPNGNRGADGMASIVAHELEEAHTDPQVTAWYDRRGYENADKCAWTFGTTYTTSNGAKANMRLGSRDYLIQRNWVNANGGYCATSY